ncbi:MAG: hypothetical protein AB1768_17800 [Pseudomonadota bacterium]|jgi:hypothetical protein
MATNIYPTIIEILSKASAPMTAREVFNQLDVPGVKAHDVSKALNNLKTMGRVDSVPATDLGRCAHRWFAASQPIHRKTAAPLFRFTESGALAIATDTIGVVVPSHIVPKLRQFLLESKEPRRHKRSHHDGILGTSMKSAQRRT